MSEKYVQQGLYNKPKDIPKEEAEELEKEAHFDGGKDDGIEFSDEANQLLAEMDGGPKARHIPSANTRKTTKDIKKTLREAREKLEGKSPKDLFKK